MAGQLQSIRGKLELSTKHLPVRLLSRRVQDHGSVFGPGRDSTKVIAKFTYDGINWTIHIRDIHGATCDGKILDLYAKIVLRNGMKLELDGIEYEFTQSPFFTPAEGTATMDFPRGMLVHPLPPTDEMILYGTLASWKGPWRYVDVLYQVWKLYAPVVGSRPQWPLEVAGMLLAAPRVTLEFVSGCTGGGSRQHDDEIRSRPQRSEAMICSKNSVQALFMLNTPSYENQVSRITAWERRRHQLKRRAQKPAVDGHHKPEVVMQMLSAAQNFDYLTRMAVQLLHMQSVPKLDCARVSQKRAALALFRVLVENCRALRTSRGFDFHKTMRDRKLVDRVFIEAIRDMELT